MLLTLIPFFDESMTVSAYSFFSQKQNYLTEPRLQGTSSFDGAAEILAFDVIKKIGLDSLSNGKEVFVPVNNISLFADINAQCNAPHNKVMLLLDNSIEPNDLYINRIKELKSAGYLFAIRKVAVQNYERYSPIFKLMDFIVLDHKKIDLFKAKLYFNKVFPNVKLVAGNIETVDIFEALKKEGGYELYEGEFFRIPINKGEHDVSPLKVNYIRLLNVVNNDNFDLSKAADIVGQDTALVISLLKMVNTMSINSEITSIRHAAAMLGQKELKKWINTAVTNELYADKPNEVTRLSLIRAKFAENLAPAFEMAVHASELFLMGVFSVIDIILEMPMEKALEIVTVSKEVKETLVEKKGKYAPVYYFMVKYEEADWQEVSRLMIIHNISLDQVYSAYIDALKWYKDLFF